MRWLVLTILVLFVVGIIGFSNPVPGDDLATATGLTRPASTQPVILELFTSEGCSSCPPADAFLKRLDDAGRLDGAEIIAIEEHVDYWNRLGWTDPFSSGEWTDRQERYAQAFRRDGVYTPQLVVNGRDELVGSSDRQVREAVGKAAAISSADLIISAVDVTGNAAAISFAVQNLPNEARSSQVWLAVTERGLASNVLHGENQGRNLRHAAILRSLTSVKYSPSHSSEASTTTAKVSLDPSWKRENLRFVVFLQEPKSLHIFGAAAASAPR